jgi:hypothetical protein
MSFLFDVIFIREKTKFFWSQIKMTEKRQLFGRETFLKIIMKGIVS